MPEYSKTDEIIKASEELLEQTLLKNSDAVAKALDETHIHVTSNRNYNNENALAAAVYIAFVHALNYYNCFKELSTGKGFADLVYVPVVKSPEHPAIIMELKHNQSTGKALQQTTPSTTIKATSFSSPSTTTRTPKSTSARLRSGKNKKHQLPSIFINPTNWKEF